MRNVFVGLLAISVLMAFFLGYASNVTLRADVEPAATPLPSAFSDALTPTVQPAYRVHIQLPAVAKSGEGALATFTVETAPGNGRVFIGVSDGPLVNADTQGSLRIALDVAKHAIAGEDPDLDVFYTFSTESDAVGGKSAGAAVSVATMAALQHATLRADTLITGTVEADGRIGPVGKILEKALAVKKAGYTTFLVPAGESKASVSVQECQDKRRGSVVTSVCTSTVKQVDIQSQVPGLQVLEVSDVREAYRLMKAG